MNPGVTYLPAPSITWAPSGTSTDARGPTAAMRFPSMSSVPSARGGPPLPSMMTAPTIAMGAAAGVWAARGTAGRNASAAVVMGKTRIG